MKKSFILYIIIFFISCSSERNIIYIKDSEAFSQTILKINNNSNKISSGDILKIDIVTLIPEASIPYNKYSEINSVQRDLTTLKLDGYLVDNAYNINFPILGKINVQNLDLNEISLKIRNILLDGNHLVNPTVNVRRVNSKFTVLGEVNSPGTFSFFDERINIFQALGYAGDLSIDGRRNTIKLIRENNGIRKVFEIELTKSSIMNKPYYYISNNDVIIVSPTFSKVKSAGFIGSPSSIASISSLILSITLLIINN
jgi:polysaccharide export outer membrane protein